MVNVAKVSLQAVPIGPPSAPCDASRDRGSRVGLGGSTRTVGEPINSRRPSSIIDRMGLKVIYKITYPNGKIYVGQDLPNSPGYFGSPSWKAIAADFTPEQFCDFTIRKQILWQSLDATSEEVDAKEIEFILSLRSNDPSIGYNRTIKPQSRFKKKTSLEPPSQF